MRNFISSRAEKVQPSGIRKFFDIVSEMEGAISLGVGEPDFITSWQIRDSAIKSLQKGYTQYTSNSGLIELRELVSKYMSERFNIKFAPSEIVMTVGASEGIDITLRSIIDSGDEILIPDPSYVSYAPSVMLCGGVPVAIKCYEENGFKLTAEMIEKSVTPKTKAIILPYPNNPTGAIMEREYLEEIAPVIIKHDLLVISDEIYAELTYGTKHVSIFEIDGMSERTVIISGFSKAFAMTGWRIGFVMAKGELFKTILKIHQYVIMCAPTISQYAGIGALKDGFSDDFSAVFEMKEEYNKRRRFMVKSFNDMGLHCFEPRGAFYVFPSVKSLNMTGEEFATKLLESEKVAVVPGSAFGNAGLYHIRCSYAYSMKNLKIAVDRINRFVESLKK